MEEESKEKEIYPKLLHLIPNEGEWKPIINQKTANLTNKLLDQDERELELKLGLPGRDIEETEEKPSLHSLGYSLNAFHSSSASHGAKRAFSDAIKYKSQVYNARMGKELSLGTSVEREKNKQCQETEAIRKPLATAQERNAAAPVVGWPPVRSFRKNIASSSKQLPEPQKYETEANPNTNSRKGNFVKINMDGVPIGRKVDLSAYDGYEKLCLAVKELFKGFYQVQKDSSKVGDGESRENGEDEIFSCLLDGSGEYTLVYEDTEGDRVLASDVPWRLFVSSARRLRVIKSSELSRLPTGSISRRKSSTVQHIVKS